MHIHCVLLNTSRIMLFVHFFIFFFVFGLGFLCLLFVYNCFQFILIFVYVALIVFAFCYFLLSIWLLCSFIISNAMKLVIQDVNWNNYVYYFEYFIDLLYCIQFPPNVWFIILLYLLLHLDHFQTLNQASNMYCFLFNTDNLICPELSICMCRFPLCTNCL